MDFVLRSKLLLRILKLDFLRENRNTLKCNEVSTRHALFWVITQRVLVVSYRRFGDTYRYLFQGQGFWIIALRIWDWQFVPEREWKIITTGCVVTQKTLDLIQFPAKAWSYTSSHDIPHPKRRSNLFVFTTTALHCNCVHDHSTALQLLESKF